MNCTCVWAAYSDAGYLTSDPKVMMQKDSTGCVVHGEPLGPGQWCTLHNRHQDDPEHDYQYPACESYMREATHEEARLFSPEYAAAFYLSHKPPYLSIVMVIAKALGWAEGEHPRWNAAVMVDAEKVWAALMDEGFTEDRIDIGASGYCEALVLFFKYHA